MPFAVEKSAVYQKAAAFTKADRRNFFTITREASLVRGCSASLREPRHLASTNDWGISDENMVGRTCTYGDTWLHPQH